MSHLSFARLGNYGRLGNQLFEIAGTIGLAAKHGLKPAFPQWAYDKYFQQPIPKGPMQRNQVKEAHFHVHDWNIPATGCDILGYLQSEKYFDRETIRLQFTFRPEFVQHVKSKVPADLFSKPTLVFQIRRTDYVGNPNYYQLSIEYYIDALLTHFPDWRQYNILMFSDDLPYCRIHFECLPNVYFTDALTDIEQMCLATLCDHFIIPNSSYGWWCAWLGEKPHSKVIHCGHLQAGELLKRNDPKDYWPERWTKHEKPSYKLNLQDVTFTIPVHYDHPDRKKNLDLSLCMLLKSFETNVIVAEQGTKQFEYVAQWAKYVHYDVQYFHRTKMLNDMAKQAGTPYVVNWDCDVIIPPMQVYLMAEALRGGADFVYPYDGTFARMNRGRLFPVLEKYTDIGQIRDEKLTGKHGGPVPVSSVGGAVGVNMDAFTDAGLENEHFISYGPEDVERYERWHKLGYKVQRIGGSLYHMDHFIGPNSSKAHPHFNGNNKELERIRSMDADALRSYIDTWQWRHQYTSAYYKRISGESEQSASEVFKALAAIGIKPTSVLDVGCGCGAWVQPGVKWVGLDHGVPAKAIYPGVEFHDVDLSADVILPPLGRFDLVICMEVAEHLPESQAESLVSLLTAHADRVLFSAAIPKQGGQGHVNEKWQTWWANLFSKYGYFAAKKQPDIRFNKSVALWYRQNTVLYERGGKGKVEDYVLPEYYAEITKNL